VTLLKSLAARTAIAGLMAVGAFTATASADVACNQAGECWHVHDRLIYPAGVGITFHDDAWARAHRHGYHWRADRFDHGYYRNGVWITF